MKTCPFCAEDIQDAAIKCRHCGSMLDERAVHRPDGANPVLPFAPISNATPTSGILWLLMAVLLLILSFVIGPIGPAVLVLGTSIWVAVDASTHKLASYKNGIGGPTAACLGSLLLWIIVFPWYLAVRSRIRAGVQPVKV